jgi:hypothetical protein
MNASKSGEMCFACKVVDDLIQVGSYWLCAEHKGKQEERNAEVFLN